MSDDENPPPEGGTALENLSSEKKKESGPVDDASAIENGDLNEDFKTSPDENKSPSDNSSRTRKLSAPQPQSRVRKSSIIKNSTSERSERSRKYSEGNIHSSRQRKISFLNSDALVPPPEDEPRRPVEDACTDSDSLSAPLTSRLHMSMGDDEEYNDRFSNLEKRESLAFLQVVQERLTPKASCASLAYRGSRASFSTLGASTGGVNMASRPSMVSLKETLSRVNLELHPEKGSFVAFSMGQSMASIPTIAAKVYIITQVLAAISVSMGSMAVGFTAGWTSPALESMKEENSTLTITSEQESWVGSLMPLSALVGSVIGGYLVDAIGRKMLICSCGPPFIVAYVLMGAATNVWMLYVGRSLAGLCVGFLTLTLPVYLGETIQAEIRGTLGLLPTTLGNGGILMCFLAGAYVNWSTLAYIGTAIPAVFLVLMIFVPETPRWYISKEREADAYRSLCWLRGTNADVDSELEEIMLNHEMSASQSSSVKELFTKQYFKPFAIAMLLMSFQQLSGINAVIFYSVSIFNSAGTTLDSNLCSVIIGVVNLLSTFLATALIDRLGRKILLYISDVLIVISLISLAVFFYFKQYAETNESWKLTMDNISWIPLVNLILYVLGFSLGWGPIPWLFMGEALPAKIRGPAASIVTAFNWACTFAITKLFPGMLELFGETGVFALFACIMILGTIFSVLMVPETKGLSLEEIESIMMGRKQHNTMNRKMSEVSGIMMS